MDRVKAYGKLAAELERWRRLPFDDLVRLVGASPSGTSVLVGAEVIDVEVSITWAEAKPGGAERAGRKGSGTESGNLTLCS